MHVKRNISLVGLTLTALVGSFYLAARSLSPPLLPPAPSAGGAAPNPQRLGPASSTQPRIKWSEKSVEVILSPGESATKNLTFASTLDLENVMIEAVPEIAGFLSIQPNSFGSVQMNQQQAVSIFFSVPTTASLGTFDGTIHMRTANRTVPQTLKVIVNIWKASQVSSSSATVEFNYPPDWRAAAEGTPTVDLFGASSAEAIDAGDLVTPPDITMALLDNLRALTLRDFVNAYRDGWFATYRDTSFAIVGGRNAILVSDLGNEIPHSPSLAAFIALENSVVLVAGKGSTQAEFNDILSTLSFR